MRRMITRRAPLTAFALCASVMACAKESQGPSAFPGVSGDASAPSGSGVDDLDELMALETRLAGLRGQLDRSTYLAQVPGDRAFEAQVESVAVGEDEAERTSPKRGASRDRVSRRESKAKKDGEGGGGAAPSAPAEEAAKVADAEQTSQERPAPIAGGDAAAAGATASTSPAANFADDTPTCPKVCSLSESICELTDRVCSLASRHEGEPRFEAACSRAKTDCTDAVAACTACTVTE